MNAPTKILEVDPFASATERANCWRGWMVNQFAKGEMLIASAIAVNGDAKIPTVLKQRVDRLRPIVEEQAQVALDRFLDLSRHRNALAHGEGLITIDRKGQWMLRLTFYDKDSRTSIIHYEPDAQALREEIRNANAVLKAALP